MSENKYLREMGINVDLVENMAGLNVITWCL